MVSREQLEQLSQRIAEEFNPERIVLFGSYAYGEPHAGSDVDLLVILPFEGSSLRKSLEILERVNPSFPVDLIVRHPKDALRRYQQGDPLIREALNRERDLFRREAA